MKINITLHGIPPSKKNSKRFIKRGARRFLIPSLLHENWHDVAYFEVIRQVAPHKANIPAPVAEIKVLYFPKDKRRRDLTNATESVMDLLVDCGVIEDDNWFVVPKITLEREYVSLTDPRTEVVIHTRDL